MSNSKDWEARRRREIFEDDELFYKWVNAVNILSYSKEKLGLSIEERQSIWKMLHGTPADINLALEILEQYKAHNET
jgi:hypothetical protein